MNDRFLIHDEATEENSLDEPLNDDIVQENDSSNDQTLQSTPQEKIIAGRDISVEQQASTPIAAQPAPQKMNGDGPQPWFRNDEVESIHSRWMEIQTKFVDTPYQAVSQGDELVSETVEQMREMISSLYSNVCDKWSNRNDLSTEDMRIVMQDYRALLNRLLDH